MSSKSEYERLAEALPDVVKVIREQVLNEAIQAVLKVASGGSIGQGSIHTVDAIAAITVLKNK